ncbi:MAG TPA: glycerol-3-phosphate 1-O-acyltransferase PlsY [Mariprofundaceae bacterium]|nr:glycerol-3-phosphate 1-O-acyltransferase PlsY [Mariprofundaceae bacterium]
MLSMPEMALVFGAYLLGAIPFGLLFTRWLAGKDPRKHGSGNIGATNTMRTGGKALGLMTLAADIGKGALPVALALRFGGDLLTAMTAGAAFLGHIFPVYLRFRGGKGVATMFGVLLPWQPLVAGIAFGIWLLALAIGRYVSVASILAALSLPPLAHALHASDTTVMADILFSLMVLLRHGSNIRKVMAGTEDRIGNRKH